MPQAAQLMPDFFTQIYRLVGPVTDVAILLFVIGFCIGKGYHYAKNR